MFSNKKKRHYKYINGTKGVISLFLCLVLSPIMTLVLGLVEYHRYQSIIEITDELLELVGVSELAEYDSYIHDRFGLLALSQESEPGTNAQIYADQAAASTGKQIELENVTVTGKLTLEEPRVMKQQIYDFSELAVTSSILMDDFNIQQLINALNMVERFNTIIKSVQTLADLAEKLTTAVEAGETLLEKLETLEEKINQAKSLGEGLASKVQEFYKTLSDAGLTIPEGATAEQIAQIVSTIAENYKEDITELVSLAKNLKESVSGLKSAAEECATAAKAFMTAVEAASNVLVSDGGDANNASISASAKNTLSEVLDDLLKMAEETFEKIGDEAVQTLKSEVNAFLDAAFDSLGIGSMIDRYSSIASGSYFTLPLSDQAKSDLTKLISLMPSDGWSETAASNILAELKEMFVPKITFKPDQLINELNKALENAAEKIATNSIKKALELIKKLINALKNIFDLDVFYEANLNAFVDVAEASSDNPYQTFLDGIGTLFDAVEDFSEAITSLNPLKKLVSGLSAVNKLFSGIAQVLAGLTLSAANTITNVAKIVVQLGSGDVEALYKRLLVAGYMRHNLPCRTDSANLDASFEDGTIAGWTELEGEGLTGFQYNDIARARDIYGQTASSDKGDEPTVFQKIASTMANLKNGAGQDRTFKGAELEYIRAGTNSELANQIFVFFDIYFLRVLLNAPTVFGDAEVASLAAAATIASWVVYLIYLLVEPFCDTILLVNGAEISFIKNKCYLTAGGFKEFTDALMDATMSDALRNDIIRATGEMKDAESGAEKGMGKAESVVSDLTKVDYQTHMLLVLLINVKEDTMIQRFSDIVEMEAKEYYREKGLEFSMLETYATFTVSADATFNSFFNLGVASGGSPLDISGTISRDLGY